MPKVKPILCNTEMVSALLDGRKTVTRRVVKPQPIDEPILDDNEEEGGISIFCHIDGEDALQDIFPPYQPLDVMYVRETFSPLYPDGESNEVCGYMYKADSLEDYGRRYPIPGWKGFQWDGIWHPSIHMPKDAARIWLKVTDVRVERLQDMKMGDMRAEGMVPLEVTGGQWQQWQQDYAKPAWDSTIKKLDLRRYGWDANPFVWRIEFERCGKPESGVG